MEIIVIIAAVIELFAFMPYIRGIISGEVKPNLVSWILWSLSPLLATIISFNAGVGWAVLLPGAMSGIGPMIIVTTALIKKGARWKITTFDYICGASSIIALILWLITGSTNLGLSFAILSDLLAAIPTLKKSWTHPETENYVIFLVTFFTKIAVFFVVKDWSFAELGFTIYLMIMCATLAITRWGRGYIKKQKALV